MACRRLACLLWGDATARMAFCHNRPETISTRLPPRLTSLSLEVESDFRVDPITRDFAVVHRGGEFLDVNRADIAQGFRGFSYRGLAASSQFFGDSDSSSMTLTTLAMLVILLSLMIEWNACDALLISRLQGNSRYRRHQGRSADGLSMR